MAQSGKYDFDDEFLTKLVALVVCDPQFAESTHGLIKHEYIPNDVDAYLVDLVLKYYAIYRATPSRAAIVQELHKAKAANAIRQDLLNDVVSRYRELLQVDLTDRQYVVDQVAEFARHQEMTGAIMESVTLLQKGDYDAIDQRVRQALLVGATSAKSYDYSEEIDNRTERRKELAAGRIQPSGVTTGVLDLDNRLKHRGFGKGELSVWMGFLKSGKSFALLHSAVAAMLSGHNTLYITLENSLEVTYDRFDAHITGIPTNQLQLYPDDVKHKLEQHLQAGRAGLLKIEEYPIGTVAPKDVDRLVQQYKTRGVIFQSLIVDYLDVMIPNRIAKNDPIENSKNIWVDMRAIAQRENLALVTATQTNRGGASAAVADATHVADDINKIRIADLAISINRDEDDRKKGEARLFMAAGRNQEDAITIRVKQDLARAKFIVDVLGIS